MGSPLSGHFPARRKPRTRYDSLARVLGKHIDCLHDELRWYDSGEADRITGSWIRDLFSYQAYNGLDDFSEVGAAFVIAVRESEVDWSPAISAKHSKVEPDVFYALGRN